MIHCPLYLSRNSYIDLIPRRTLITDLLSWYYLITPWGWEAVSHRCPTPTAIQFSTVQHRNWWLVFAHTNLSQNWHDVDRIWSTAYHLTQTCRFLMASRANAPTRLKCLGRGGWSVYKVECLLDGRSHALGSLWERSPETKMFLFFPKREFQSILVSWFNRFRFFFFFILKILWSRKSQGPTPVAVEKWHTFDAEHLKTSGSMFLTAASALTATDRGDGGSPRLEILSLPVISL